MHIARASAPQPLWNYRSTGACCTATGTATAWHSDDKARAIEDGHGTGTNPKNADRRPARSAATCPAHATIAARTAIAALADLVCTHRRTHARRATLPCDAARTTVAAFATVASGKYTRVNGGRCVEQVHGKRAPAISAPKTPSRATATASGTASAVATAVVAGQAVLTTAAAATATAITGRANAAY